MKFNFKKRQVSLQLAAVVLLAIFGFGYQNCAQPTQFTKAQDTLGGAFDLAPIVADVPVVDVPVVDVPVVDVPVVDVPVADVPVADVPVADVPVADVPVIERVPEYVTKSKKFAAARKSIDKVDVLVVIDNSGSMDFEQQSMGNRFSSFLDQVQGLDWQVGIVTTDVSTTKATGDGKLLDFGSGKFLIKSSEDLTTAKNLFAKTIQRTEVGSSKEQGLKATIRALQRAATAGDVNRQMLRTDGALSVIVVTDANESGATLPEELLNHMTKNYPEKSFKFHSIVVKSNDQACLHTNGNETYGTKYEALSKSTFGVIGSVCSTDYGSQLKTIGQSTADQIKQVTLECAPVDKDKNGFADIEIRDESTNALIFNYIVQGVQINFDQALPASSYMAKYTCLK